MHARLTVQFGAGLTAVALTALLGLAAGGGPQPADAIISVLAGIGLVATGLAGRSPARAQGAWLVAVLIAGGLMFSTVRGFTTLFSALAGGSLPHWWLLLQGAIFVAAGAFIVALAWINVREGRRSVLAANARRSKQSRRQR